MALFYQPSNGTMNKRLEMLTRLVESGQADSFARYALALEYKKAERSSEALAVFRALREADPDYLPMYYLCGTLLSELDREDEARDWFSAGIEVAAKQGESKTESELRAALEEL